MESGNGLSKYVDASLKMGQVNEDVLINNGISFTKKIHWKADKQGDTLWLPIKFSVYKLSGRDEIAVS